MVIDAWINPSPCRLWNKQVFTTLTQLKWFMPSQGHGQCRETSLVAGECGLPWMLEAEVWLYRINSKHRLATGSQQRTSRYTSADMIDTLMQV